MVLLAPSGTPLEICCAAVQMGVMSFVDTECARLAGAAGRGTAADPLLESRQVLAGGALSPQQLLDAAGIMAISPAMQDLIVQVHRAAQVSDATVLIQGESGTGKQLLAEAIHHLDPDAGALPSCPVNCAAIPEHPARIRTLRPRPRRLHRRQRDKQAGYFEPPTAAPSSSTKSAHSPALQPKLLRVLAGKRVLPVGDRTAKNPSTSASSPPPTRTSRRRSPTASSARTSIYRLNVIHLTCPRCASAPRTSRCWCNISSRNIPADEPAVGGDHPPPSSNCSSGHLWPGNVRELENVIRQTLVFKTTGDRLELSDLPRYLFQAETRRRPAS